MNLQKRIEVLVTLGKKLQEDEATLNKAIFKACIENQWFTFEHCRLAIHGIITHFLQKDKLEYWLQSYEWDKNTEVKKTVGLVMAGNIPLVGFHDALCVFVSGHKAQIKLSSKDKTLFKHLLLTMLAIDREVNDYFEITERLKGFDAVIATGSNNSARYFDHYFGKYPNIIRKNRQSIAILSGNETPEDIALLSDDIFQHFGLGCRNVSKLMVPVGYDFTYFFDHLQYSNDIKNHNKYGNNFDYVRSLLLLNNTPHLSDDVLMVTENKALASPTSLLHYEYYESEDDLANKLIDMRNDIQCVVGNPKIQGNCVPFGKAQQPELWDYADGVDTLAFLLGLTA